jgi:hypothetical protein
VAGAPASQPAVSPASCRRYVSGLREPLLVARIVREVIGVAFDRQAAVSRIVGN